MKKPFISSACVKNDKILDSVKELKSYGFNSIELSGGTKYYSNLKKDLLFAKNELGVKLLLHNYFPPPKENFVLNLASNNSSIYKQSIEHCKRAIELSIDLDTKSYGIHAGFFIDIKVEEIGKKLSPSALTNKFEAIDRFCNAYQELTKFAGSDLMLFIENNVFSKSNFDSFEGTNPLMLTDVASYKELKSKIDFNLLLDIAHLKVSTKTLNLDFKSELKFLFSQSSYIHISDNDGFHDSNCALLKDSALFETLNELNWENKIVSLEVYDSLDKVIESEENINLILNARTTKV